MCYTGIEHKYESLRAQSSTQRQYIVGAINGWNKLAKG